MNFARRFCVAFIAISSFQWNSSAFLLKYTSDNVTFFHGSFSKQFMNSRSLPWWCTCSNELLEVENESECHCEGKELLQLPQVLQNITRLSISNANLEILQQSDLLRYSDTLKDFFLTSVPFFSHIEPKTFQHVPHLRTIYISHAPRLLYISSEVFMYITSSFKVLRILQSGLQAIPDLIISPSVGILSQLDFEGNEITEISRNSIQVRTEMLILDNNNLISIKRAAFNGSEIGQLSLRNNKNLHLLDENAFEGVLYLRELDLSRTAITSLPYNGLNHLEILRIRNTHSLIRIPSVYKFMDLEKAFLTHPFHCCAFQFPSRHDPETHTKRLAILERLQIECLNSTESKTIARKKRDVAQLDSVGLIDDDDDEDDEKSFFHPPVASPKNVEVMCGNISFLVRKIQCYPIPDALNPCEDVMGSQLLRISVWIVVSFAVVGNTSVLVVLLSDYSLFTVPKFLMCNLAFADLVMGLYLLLLALVDLHSTGEYFNNAWHWQYGFGCRLAGFLTVFASQLSIFTLTIITIERWFAITKAIFLAKRLNRRNATIIMISGYIFSIVLATLPLVGISNYSSTSICLPMKAEDPLDMIYLLTLLAASSIGFTIMVVCYLHIYFHLHMVDVAHGCVFNRETAATKKMALLVFTNFACFAPIAFFGLSALAGHSFIDVTHGKFLLVFIYPLNSCANPYLYAIFTQQFRREALNMSSKCGCARQQQEEKICLRQTSNTNCVSTNVSIHSRSSKKGALCERKSIELKL